MKTKVLLAALLVAAVPTVSLFASCAKDQTEDQQNETVNGENQQQEEKELTNEEKLELEYSPNVPADLKFDGETFSILIGSVGQRGLYAEEETSDLVNDTVFRRNKLIEERFGITYNAVKTGAAATGGGQAEAVQQFRSLIEANDSTYHAFTHVQHSGMPQMTLERYFVDWNTIPYINLEENWWYQNITKDLSFGDKVYVMTGDYAVYVDSIDCLVFNKEIFDELELEYPYQDVIDGTWTFDKFTDLVKQGAKDLDGDGLMNIETDRYGLVGWVYELAPALLVSTGYSPLERDADNLPVLNQNVDTAHAIYDDIVNIFVDGQSAHAEATTTSVYHTAFSTGRAMFKDVFLAGVVGLSDLEFDFGILPYPKYTEDGEYQSRSSNMTALTYIPVTNANLEMTGAVLEELAFQSAKELTPTYFDIVLTVKNTRDTESEGMLPIIRDSARFLYNGYAPNIISMVTSKSNSYASSYASNLTAYQEELDEMRELLTEE